MILVGNAQAVGTRANQEDYFASVEIGDGVLSIVSDGMGGYEGGEIASKLVSENFRDFSIDGDIGESLKKYLLKGNDAIKEYKKDHPNVKSMGTTAIAFFMTDKNCQWVSVGDSPLYVIQNRSSIKRINENHSVAGLLDLQVKKGEISKEEAFSCVFRSKRGLKEYTPHLSGCFLAYGLTSSELLASVAVRV